MKILFLLIPWILYAQVTSADYERARGLKDRFQGLAVNVPGPITWIGDTGRFWYRKSAPKGSEFVLVDAPKGVKTTPFAHPIALSRVGAAIYRADPAIFRIQVC